jgi:MFS family permease
LISTGFVAFYIVDRFPRRTLFLTSTIGILTSYCIWTALQATYDKQVAATGTGSPALAKGVLAMIVMFNTSFNIGWTPLQVTYVVEILPFNLRARGLVIYSFAVALALIFNQYANPIALTALKWKYYIVYDVWIAFELIVIYFLFIETRGSSLEEISFKIDGVEIKDKLSDGVAETTENEIPIDEKRAGGEHINVEHV